MKIDDILKTPVGQSFDIQGVWITREIIQKVAEISGCEALPHVQGVRSVFSLGLGVEGGACLHGTGTLCLINSSLQKAFTIEDEHDIISYGYDKVTFESPNIEGGRLSCKLTVKAIERTRLPVRKLKKVIPVVKVTLGCEAFNSRFKRRVAKLEWTIGFLKMSDVP
jgi:acyl dehydratase